MLDRFDGAHDGCGPYAGVVIGNDGVLYGTTLYGGTSGDGTVFALSPPPSPGGSWSKRTLYNFTGAPGDGYYPTGLLIGRDGVLYGTTQGGGTGSCTDPFSGCGTVFSLTPPASPEGAWTEAVLHNFAAGGDGASPSGSLVMGSGPGGRPVLYGTTPSGGTGPCEVSLSYGCGTVFALAAPASPGGAWTEAILHTFMGTARDGAYPVAGLAIGSGPGGHPVLYGTNAGASSNGGVVFSLTPPATEGGAWTETVLYTLPGSSDSSGPDAVLAIGTGPGGYPMLYGTTSSGGTPMDLGTVFSFKPYNLREERDRVS